MRRRSKPGWVPTAWVRLGAQPDGPIPRFLGWANIPDPDGPSCSSGGTRARGPGKHLPEPDPCGTALYTGGCCTSTVNRTLSPSRGPSAAKHHDSRWRVRPANTASNHPRTRAVHFFKLQGGTAISLFLYCGEEDLVIWTPPGAWPQCRALRRYPQRRPSQVDGPRCSPHGLPLDSASPCRLPTTAPLPWAVGVGPRVQSGWSLPWKWPHHDGL